MDIDEQEALGEGYSGEPQAHRRQALAIFDRLQTTDADQVRALLAEPALSA